MKGPPSKRTLEKRIKRALKEIEEIESTFYKDPEADLDNQAFLVELRRKNAIRSTVLELHLSIEDLLTDWLKACLLGYRLRVSRSLLHRSQASRMLDGLLIGGGSIGFDRKITLLRALRFISKPVYDKLRVLNVIRNKCSHNWELNYVLRRGRKPRQSKPPLLEYKGKSLFKLPVLHDFLAEYGGLYFKLFLKVYE